MSITKIIADHPVYTCVMVFDKKVTKTLFCIRTKEPFKGKYNFNGGKVDKDEEPLANAYREIEEETGITSEDIKLKLLMTFEFNLDNIKMYAFAGILNKEVELKKELNDLEWVSLEDDFSNSDKYAGNGNIETMIAAFLQNIEKFE